MWLSRLLAISNSVWNKVNLLHFLYISASDKTKLFAENIYEENAWTFIYTGWTP